MLIDLLTITESGISCDFDEFSSEMSGAFTDLIEQVPFNIHITINPLANAYRISGKFSSRSMEICSRCGYDIHYPLENFINEIIIIEEQRPKNTQVSQSSRNFDKENPSVTYINKPQFDLKEFFHEIVAASLDPFPVCKDPEVCQSRQFVLKGTNIDKFEGHPGFALLKNFKVTS